jgi:hypothetical protein
MQLRCLVRPQLLLPALVLMSMTLLAKADPITYTVTDTASGSLGSSNFTDQDVTVTFTGDTSNVTQQDGDPSYNPLGVATIDIAGLGTFTFTDIIFVAINHAYDFASIADQRGAEILGHL